MSNGGFTIPTESHTNLINEVAACSFFSRKRASLNPSDLYWQLYGRKEPGLPEEWNEAQRQECKDSMAAYDERMRLAWLRFKKMKEEGNAPQSASDMCAFLFCKEDDDGSH